jgi:hypothetical protein
MFPSIVVAFFLALVPVHAIAQQPPAAPPMASPVHSPSLLVEGAFGLASFVDDAPVRFTYFGGSCLGYLSNRVAIGQSSST